MTTYYGSKTDVVRFVSVTLLIWDFDLHAITITKLARYGAYSVRIATDGSWEDIVERLALTCSLKPRSIYFEKNTPDG